MADSDIPPVPRSRHHVKPGDPLMSAVHEVFSADGKPLPEKGLSHTTMPEPKSLDAYKAEEGIADDGSDKTVTAEAIVTTAAPASEAAEAASGSSETATTAYTYPVDLGPVIEPHWYSPLTAEELKHLQGKASGTEDHAGSEVLSRLSQLSRKHKDTRIVPLFVPRVQESDDGCNYSMDFPSVVVAKKALVSSTIGGNLRDLDTLYSDVSLNTHLIRNVINGTYPVFGFLPDTDMFVSTANKINDRVPFIRYAWSAYLGITTGMDTKNWINEGEGTASGIPDQIAGTTNKKRVPSVTWTDGVLELDGDDKIYYDVAPEKFKRPEPGEKNVADLSRTGCNGAAQKRPNGDVYHPRQIRVGNVTLWDVDVVRAAYGNRIPALLYGVPGTGKTAVLEASLENLVTLTCTADTEVSDFVGSWVQTGGDKFAWKDGPLVIAMENGYPLFVDEIALADSRELAVLYSVMDGRDEITIRANPDRPPVVAKDGFAVFGACNPDVPGAVMSDALMSRFLLQIQYETDYDMLVKLGIDPEVITVARNLAKKVESNDLVRAPQTRELLGYKRVKDVFGQEMALANLIATADEADRGEYIAVVKSTFSVDLSELTVGPKRAPRK